MVKRNLTTILSGCVLAAFCAVSPWVAADDIATTFSYFDPNANTVGVAGEFSNWSIQPMTKDAAGNWTKTLYLRPGYYGYKFVVNGEWVFDPKNPARKTVNDIENSAITVGGVQPAPGVAPVVTGGNVEVTFSFHEPFARSIHVAGEFNGWLIASEATIFQKPEWAMVNDGAGNWKLTTQLPPGRHQFKYVIDGGGSADRWKTDPKLPTSADGNSIIEVRAGVAPTPVAPAPVAPTPVVAGATDVSFTYADPAAKSVSVAGEFNQWNASANPLSKDEFGIWTTRISLRPGRYQYKFVVDGVWKQDPANPETTDDGFGGFNSVKVVTQ